MGVSVLDVAAYLLKMHGAMTVMKLQKLVYYCQAWSLVWDERPMFREPIQAWANGPVCRRLYDAHKGQFKVSAVEGGSHTKLDKDARDTCNAILKAYGDKSAIWLSDLTHLERPWREARAGIPDGERSERIISHASMAEYYGGLGPAD